MLTADQIEPHGFEEGSEDDDEVVEEVEEHRLMSVSLSVGRSVY